MRRAGPADPVISAQFRRSIPLTGPPIAAPAGMQAAVLALACGT
jgi:hypothetical protein